MRLSDKVYDFLKWVALVAVPAVEAFWLTIGKTWGFPYLTEIGTTIAAVGLLIAALIGVSSVSYNKFVMLQNHPEPEDSYVEEYEVFDYGDGDVTVVGGEADE